MTAGGDEYTQPLMWYEGFEKWMHWKNLAVILGADKVEEAKEAGEKII